MHETIVKLKNGETYSGSINYFRPAFGWFSLFGIDRKFYFDECESVITPGQRVSIHSPPEGEVQDEIARAKRELDDGRIYGWEQDGQPYPLTRFEWEKKYET